MREDGFTLLEIIITVTIIGILLALATIDFNAYTTRQNTQAQVKTMFTDLLAAKVDAMHKNIQYNALIKVDTSPNSYTITDGNGIVTAQRSLKYTITTSAGAGNNLTLQFDNRGFNVTAGAPQAVCIAADNDLAYDSVVIDQVKVNLAKKSAGANCASANCKIQ